MNRGELLTKLAMELAEWPSQPKEIFDWAEHKGFRGARLEGSSGVILAVEVDGVTITRSEYLAERKRLINKPSWEGAPGWADWLAQNETAELWCWFSEEPKETVSMGKGCWQVSGLSGLASRGAIPAGHDWRQTLERRPDSATDASSADIAELPRFRVGQVWKTRGGDAVKIVQIDDKVAPVRGELEGEHGVRRWFQNGHYEIGAEDSLDLVELLSDGSGEHYEDEAFRECERRLCRGMDDMMQAANATAAHDATAPDLLERAGQHMRDRAATYDSPEGERSMAQTVAIFNLHHGINLTEAQGWHFMRILKDVRMFTRAGYHADSAEDGIAYQALMAEAKSKEVVS